MPRVALFARRAIAAGEELTFCYGATAGAQAGGSGRARCLCGAPCCGGFLPREDV